MSQKLAAVAADTTNQGYLGIDLSLGQEISFTATATQSATLNTFKVVIRATGDCWVRWGTNPTATASSTGANASFYVQDNTYLELTFPSKDLKLSVVRGTANGTLYIWGADMAGSGS